MVLQTWKLQHKRKSCRPLGATMKQHLPQLLRKPSSDAMNLTALALGRQSMAFLRSTLQQVAMKM